MKKYLSLLAGSAILASTVATADTIVATNVNPDPYDTPWIANLPELTPEQEAMLKNLPEIKLNEEQAASPQSLPSTVDNSQNIHFRPIFSQIGGSCGQASGIGYTFTYEMSLARNLDAGLVENQYPEHHTWNFLNRGTQSGSWYYDGWNIIRDNGIPNVNTYGGMSTDSPYTEWMSGYDKYYAGMSNRTLNYFRIDVSTAEGIETLKQWFDNRTDGSSIGGIGNFACYVSNTQDAILESDSARSGETIIKRFGNSGYHAMTFVGYDDDVKVDINGDGQYTNNIDINSDGVVDVKDWEIGAVKIANSWGTGWGNNGYKWLSYSALAYDLGNGGITNTDVHVLNVKETYTPSMTLKVTMQHSSRSKIAIKTGVASSEDAIAPEHYTTYQSFNYKGGDHPMRGESTDPIEIGLDVTSLIGNVGGIENAKKFFLMIQENDSDNAATGLVLSVSAIDYLNGGIEYAATTDTVIQNNTETVIPVLLSEQGACTEFTTTNTEHETAGRAYSETVTEGETCYGTFCFGGTDVTTWYAVGSDENLGTSGYTQTTLFEQSPGIFAVGSCPTPDITAPEITILGDNPMEVYQYSEFVDPGATAIDDRDGDITANIEVTGGIDINHIGTYGIFYNATDAAGNSTRVKRTVHVVVPPACTEFTDSVANHETAGRAYSETVTEGETCYGTFCFGGTQVTTWFATGSDENLGKDGSASITLIEQPADSGIFATGECPEHNPPQIDSTNVQITGSTAVISGTASDPDGDLHAIVLYFAGGGVECEGLENWTCPAIEGLNPGDYVAAVKAVDSRIVSSPNTEIPFTIVGDRAPVIDSFEANRYQTTLVVRGEASDADGDLATVKIHGDSIGTVECLEVPSFYCNVKDLVPGETYYFYLTAEDAQGNVSEPSASIEVVMPESNAPVIETWGYEVIGADLVVSGTSSDVDGDILNTVLYVAGGGITCEGTESWTCTIPNIHAGTHAFRLKTSDSYLNDSQLIDFTVQIEASSAPTIDSFDYSVDGDTLTVTGTASDADGDLARVLLSNGAGLQLCEGTETFVCTLSGMGVGQYSFFLIAEDSQSNVSDQAGPIDVVIKGDVPVIESYDYSIAGNTLTVTGTASDTDGDLQSVVMAIGPGPMTCEGTTTFTCTISDLAAGNYTVQLIASDSAGNSSEASDAQFSITISDEAECITDTNYNHVEAGRAYVGGLSNLYAYAVGSDDDLGLYGSTYYSASTSLEETSAGVWTKVASCQ